MSFQNWAYEHFQKGVSLIYLWVDNLPYSKVDFAYKISRLKWVWEKICKTYILLSRLESSSSSVKLDKWLALLMLKSYHLAIFSANFKRPWFCRRLNYLSYVNFIQDWKTFLDFHWVSNYWRNSFIFSVMKWVWHLQTCQDLA